MVFIIFCYELAWENTPAGKAQYQRAHKRLRTILNNNGWVSQTQSTTMKWFPSYNQGRNWVLANRTAPIAALYPPGTVVWRRAQVLHCARRDWVVGGPL